MIHLKENVLYMLKNNLNNGGTKKSNKHFLHATIKLLLIVPLPKGKIIHEHSRTAPTGITISTNPYNIVLL